MAFPVVAEDIAAVVGLARREGLRVAAQATGHGAASLGSLEDTILVRTSRMVGVHIDPSTRRARVRAGTLWQDVVPAAAEHGLVPLAGSAADIGVVGYTLGGGLGWLGRRYGLAANSVIGLELVTADGQILRADRDHEPDLFWALRGGSGNFGVVTAIEFTLYPVDEIYGGVLFWDMERAAEVLTAWRDWTRTLPDEVTSVGRLLRLPPLPEVPEPLRGRDLVVVEAACLTDPAAGARLLQPLRELGPEIDTFATMPPMGLQAIHMDPDTPMPFVGDGQLLAELPPAAIEALIQAAGPGSGTTLLSVEIRHLGGALARATPEHGVLASLEAGFALFAIGLVTDSEVRTGVEAEVRTVREALRPWDTGGAFLNFAERRVHPVCLFGPERARRLQAVKARYDPDDLFQAKQPVPPDR
ncbi:MAG TPA: FAD-binding oxidoreductase [Candidatus Dormibacteraeota bacterium]|nr:FAD-binding oxidoreductase [Candidatus Dormibacteraeota bacterium]